MGFEYIAKEFKLPEGTLTIDCFHADKVLVYSNPNSKDKFQVKLISDHPIKYTKKVFDVLSNGEHTGKFISFAAYPSSGHKIHFIVNRIKRKWNGRFIGFMGKLSTPDLFAYYLDHAKEGEEVEVS